jgi:hypothetical protein
MTVSPGTVVTDLSRAPNDTTAELRGGDGPNRNLPIVDTAPPPMSHAEAVSRRDAMISDPATRDRIMQGHVETLAEWNRVIQGLAYGKVPEPSAPDSVEGLIEFACGIVPDLTEAHLDELRSSRPIDPVTRRRAEQWKEVHFRDPVFVQSYFDGDPEVARQVFHLNTLLSLPVRT